MGLINIKPRALMGLMDDPYGFDFLVENEPLRPKDTLLLQPIGYSALQWSDPSTCASTPLAPECQFTLNVVE